ncbi:thioesterase family protein, partial [Xanthomonas codiaei]
RRELKPLRRFQLQTRLVGWSGTRIVIEQRVLIGPDQRIAARALLLTGMYDRRHRVFVPAETVLRAVGVQDTTSPPLSRAAQALIASDAALKEDADDWSGA